MKKLIYFSVATILMLSLSPVFAIECPKFPEQAKKDWEVKVSAEVAKIGHLKGAELKATTKNVTQDLFAKLPDADKLYLEQMMYAAYCSTLKDDKTLSETERSKRVKKYNTEVRETINATKSRKATSKKQSPKNTLAKKPENLSPVPSAKESIVVTSHGQTGGITAQNVTVVEPSTIENVSCSKKSSAQNCPLEIDAYSYELPHPEGSNVDGILWKENIDSDVRVMLTNKSLARIQNINFILKPETYIRSAVQATNRPGVTVSPDRGPIREMALEGVDASGTRQTIAVPTIGEFIAPQVRLQGSELLGNGEMKIVLACIVLNPMVNGEFPKTLIMPRRPPKWIHIDGTYETTEAGSHKRFYFTQEFQLTK